MTKAITLAGKCTDLLLQTRVPRIANVISPLVTINDDGKAPGSNRRLPTQLSRGIENPNVQV